MPRRRYRLLTVVALVLLVMLYHVMQSSWDLKSRQRFKEVRKAPKTAVHPGLDTTSPQAPQKAVRPVSGVQLDLLRHNAAAERPLAAADTVKHESQKLAPSEARQATSTQPPVVKSSAAAEPSATAQESADDATNAASSTSNSSEEAAAPSSSDTRVHWKSFTEFFPVPTASIVPLPTGKPKAIPKIQHAFHAESEEAKTKREARRLKVKAAIAKSWASYRKNAWMHDELRPVSGTYKDPFCGWAATLVDSLDTLWIAGLKDEFDDAVTNGVANIDFTYSEKASIPVFETTIRYLGGLLSAYDVSGGHDGKYKILLDKAVELAEVLFGIFDTPNRMPVLYYNWQPEYVSQPREAGTVGVAELATLSMEFTRLSQLTKENKYYDAINRITDALIRFQDDGHAAVPGLFPEKLNAGGCDPTVAHVRKPKNQQSPQSDNFVCENKGLLPGSAYSQSFSMGGSQDSAYEYFAKEYLLLGGLEPKYQKLYEGTVDAVDEWLMYRPMMNDTNWDIYFSAKITTNGDPKRDMQVEYEATHLTCFIGGMYGIGSKIFGRQGDLETAKRLTDGCVWAYQTTSTGLMPEAAVMMHCPSLNKCDFDQAKWYESLDSIKNLRDQLVSEWELQHGAQVKSGDRSIPKRPQSHEEYVRAHIAQLKLPAGYISVPSKSYILRPEAIESVWYMYRITGDATWMDKGWAMFEATMAATETDLANSAISNVLAGYPTKNDGMESFWLAETLKYYYLLYAGPDVISLDEWVLNTEAHPFRRPQ